MTDTLKASLPPDLFNPDRLPPRREDGMVWHPDYDLIYNGLGIDDEGEAASKWLKDQGFEFTGVYMENDVEPDVMDRYFEEGAASFPSWFPSKPDGEGWLTLCIIDSEEGPIAWYIRRVPEGV